MLYYGHNNDSSPCYIFTTLRSPRDHHESTLALWNNFYHNYEMQRLPLEWETFSCFKGTIYYLVILYHNFGKRQRLLRWTELKNWNHQQTSTKFACSLKHLFYLFVSNFAPIAAPYSQKTLNESTSTDASWCFFSGRAESNTWTARKSGVTTNNHTTIRWRPIHLRN